MKATEAKSTHSQQQATAKQSFFNQEQESSFFSERSPESRPFFPSASTSSFIQPKYASEPKPFFQPTAVPFIQAKCGACEAEEREQSKEQSAETQTVQRMPAFESEEAGVQRQPLPSAVPLTVQRIPAFESEVNDKVQSQPLLQRQEETETEPEEEASPDSEVQAKLASNAVAPPEDAGENSENGLSFTQAKLTIGKPNDRYEQEADAVADQVLAMRKQRGNLAPGIQTKPLSKNISKLVQRQVVFLQPKRLQGLPKVQKQTNGSLKASSDVASRLSSSRGRGSTLDEDTRGEMETNIGADFGNVRVHTDSEATQLSQDLGAKAFTHGSDIYFNEGQYKPTSSEGKHLLAHELTHTVQQGATIQKKPLHITQHTTSPMIQGGWLSNKVEKYADKIPGYFLFKVILGYSPVTKKDVPRTGINILQGVLTLIPMLGEQWFKQLKKTGAADKAGAWLDKEIKKLDIWTGINAVVEIVKKGLRHIWRNRPLIKKTIAATVARVRQFVRNVSGKIKEFILAAALKLAGPMGAKVLAFFKKSKETFAKILANPVQFIKNFLSAFAQGFSQFGKNIAKHLKGAIIGWLLGSLSSTGVDVQIPKTFDAKSVFGLVAQVLGFTYEGIKARLLKHPKVKALGPKATKVIELLEKSVGFVKELATKGPIVLWEKVEQSLGNLKQMVFDKLKQWVVFQVIGKAIAKLLLMMNPAGGLLAVAEGIYKVVMFFIDRWDRIKSLVVSIFGSIRDIAFGNLKKAVAHVEKVLTTGLTLVISFMARYVGLGGIGKAVLKILKEIRKPIDKAMNRVIAWLVKKAKVLWKKVKAKAKKLVAWWKMRKRFKSKTGITHLLYFQGKGKTAKLMLASVTPKAVEVVINKIKSRIDKNKGNKQIQGIEEILGQALSNHRIIYKIREVIKVSKSWNEEQRTKIDKNLAKLAKNLVDLENSFIDKIPTIFNFVKKELERARNTKSVKKAMNWLEKEIKEIKSDNQKKEHKQDYLRALVKRPGNIYNELPGMRKKYAMGPKILYSPTAAILKPKNPGFIVKNENGKEEQVGNLNNIIKSRYEGRSGQFDTEVTGDGLVRQAGPFGQLGHAETRAIGRFARDIGIAKQILHKKYPHFDPMPTKDFSANLWIDLHPCEVCDPGQKEFEKQYSIKLERFYPNRNSPFHKRKN